MSLILEALKKLEREKDAPERGFLVMAHVPWAPGGRGRLRLVGGAVVVLLLAIGTVAWLVGRRGPRPAPEAARTPSARVERTSPPVPAPAPAAPVEGRAVAPAAEASAAAAETRPPATPREREQASPKSPPPPALPELRLNAISRQDGHPVALLNDRLVREGDTFDGVRVLRIGETEVEVEVGGKRRVIGF